MGCHSFARRGSALIEVSFNVEPKPSATHPCSVCGSSDSRYGLTVTGQLGTQHLFRCLGCDSYYFDGENPVVGYDDGTAEAFWLDYVQAGAGISTMLAPLHAISPAPKGELIDVGCGFGFIVDYWSFQGHEAIGLERSSYGRFGREKLDIDVRPQHVHEFRAAEPSRTFEIVYSSEVIEHTRHPDSFLSDLVSMLGPDGILVLTTPSTGAIRRDGNLASLIAALSPGFHYAILSERVLRRMFSDLGLYCHITTHDGQMIAWASRGPLPEINYGAPDWDAYLRYITHLSNSTDPHVACGALVRLFKDALNTGRHSIAASAWPRLAEAARETYGIDLLRPDLSELLANTTPLSQLDRFPSWLGNALLFGALHVGDTTGDRTTKVRMLDAALAVLQWRAEVDLQFGQEAQHFLPFARRQYLIALSEALTTSLLPLQGSKVDLDLRSSLATLRSVLTETVSTAASGVACESEVP